MTLLLSLCRGLKILSRTGLGLVYPELCQICRRARATVEQGFVCGTCSSEPGAIRRIIPPFCDRCGLPFAGAITTTFECSNCRSQTLFFQYARAATAAKGLVLDVIHRYKYNRGLWFEPFLARLLIEAAAPSVAPANWDLIVPVPLHPVKAREREFNQAERLARRLSQATGVPLNGRLLRRRHATATQTKLSRAERAANVAQAFAMRSGAKLNGERIVVIDDVFTTGATTNACAKVLRQNGAGEVCVWTVARGL